MDATLRIKNLSIALEALSRVADTGYPSVFEMVRDRLKAEITSYQKEQETATPPARPAKPTIHPDDEIPF